MCVCMTTVCFRGRERLIDRLGFYLYGFLVPRFGWRRRLDGRRDLLLDIGIRHRLWQPAEPQEHPRNVRPCMSIIRSPIPEGYDGDQQIQSGIGPLRRELEVFSGILWSTAMGMHINDEV